MPSGTTTFAVRELVALVPSVVPRTVPLPRIWTPRLWLAVEDFAIVPSATKAARPLTRSPFAAAAAAMSVSGNSGSILNPSPSRTILRELLRADLSTPCRGMDDDHSTAPPLLIFLTAIPPALVFLI